MSSSEPVTSAPGPHLSNAGTQPADPEKGVLADVSPDPSKTSDSNKAAADSNTPNPEPEKTASDPNTVTVDFEGPDDPANPLNWSKARKTYIIVVVSLLSLNVSMGPTFFAPGVPLMLKTFHTDSTSLASFSLSAYVVPFIISPLLVAPLSELFGRRIVMNVSNVLFLVFTVVCGVSNSVGLFMTFRVFQGFVGCTPLVLGGSIISDLVVLQKRGKALSGWQLGPVMGPVIGPVAGGYVAQNVSWRWLFWVIAIFSGLLVVLYLPIPETYKPRLLSEKASRLQKQNNNITYMVAGVVKRKPSELILRSIIRPLKMLSQSPILLILSLQLSLIYGYLYIMFTTVVFVFESQYNFGPGAAGLAYIGLGAGFFISLVGNALTSDRISRRDAQGGDFKPESRLAPMLIGVFCLPAGLFIYGWTAQFKVPWIVPIIGTAVAGIGTNLVWTPVQAYLVDAFHIYAASAMAACTVVRSLFGVLLPLAGQPLYNNLGLGWGNSLLAFIVLASTPLTWLIMKYGERIRLNPRFQLDL
ncbi:major facilitator superfamily domain-containing protein [Xylaria sp. CBS 124048]|nr:major facilitator superfamily domain-containing protein [Xylaria sp. CBS 124048]